MRGGLGGAMPICWNGWYLSAQGIFACVATLPAMACPLWPMHPAWAACPLPPSDSCIISVLCASICGAALAVSLFCASMASGFWVSAASAGLPLAAVHLRLR